MFSSILMNHTHSCRSSLLTCYIKFKKNRFSTCQLISLYTRKRIDRDKYKCKAFSFNSCGFERTEDETIENTVIRIDTRYKWMKVDTYGKRKRSV